MAINFNKFISQPTTTKNSGIDFNKFIKNEKGVAKTSPEIFTLSPSLGGGTFFKKEGIKEERTNYGGVPQTTGYERGDIVPVSLGGVNKSKENIQLQKLLPESQKKPGQLTDADRYLATKVLPDYKSGKISRMEAIMKMLDYQRQTGQSNPAGKNEPTSMWSPKNLWSGVKDTFAQTTQAVKDIVSSAKSEKEKLVTPSSTPQMTVSLVKNYAKSIYETDKEEIQRVKDLFSKTQTKSEKVSQGLKVITGGVGVALSPITALFEAPKDLPVLGTLSKIATLPFAVGGDIGSTEFKTGLDMLPLDKKTKSTLNDAVGEIGALAGQIVLGGEGFKKGKEFLTKKNELVEKFGEKDAETIIKKAEEKALIKPSITEATKIDFNKFIPKKEVKVEEPLLEEAKKYKSAEEFVKARGTPVYRGTVGTGEIDNISKGNFDYQFIKDDPQLRGIRGMWSEDKRVAQSYAGGLSFAQGIKSPKNIVGEGNYIIEGIKQKDGVITPLRAIEQNTKNVVEFKSQLTDIWEKANKIQPPEKIISETPSKVAKSIETKSIEEGLTKGFGDVAGYDKITIKDQAERASKVMVDMEKAKKMVKGDIPMEAGLRPEMLIKAMEDYAIKNKDTRLALDIANSPLVSETSVHAQAMRLLAERNPDSAITKMREIIKNRISAFEKKTGKKVSEAKKAEVKRMKEEIKKSIPKKDEWLEFVKEITC